MVKPAISIIIPFHGSKSDVDKCLRSILIQSFSLPHEVIIIESGQSPVLNSFISGFVNVRVIYSETILTPGKARNIGVEKAQSPLLAFTDADCSVDLEWLSELFNSLQQYQIVVGPVLNLYPFHPLASVDNLLQFIDFQKNGNTNVTHFPACNLGIRKDLFLKASGFPELLFTGEDVIFSEKIIQLSKGNVSYNKHLIVRHSGRKKLSHFLTHNSLLGFYRGLYNLKIIFPRNPERNLLFFSFYYGIRRLVYIVIKTLQWNPLGIIRLIGYFPLVLIGLVSWSKGFYKGNKLYYLNTPSVINNFPGLTNE